MGDHARYGYSRKGNRIHVPSSKTLRKSRFTLIMAISSAGVVHYEVISGNCNKESFVSFINDLPFNLVKDKTLVMDNVAFHHSKATLDAIKDKGCYVLHIPPYSPRFNAIEYAFSQIKHTYRSICSARLPYNHESYEEDYAHNNVLCQ